ncbi:MAG: bifunctional UDP-3-O-[3-hydroxymyristoyl] N-acetylglucosamine deacetylase/3-hydroxyacyl-ACP dehydratase, partial [Muribaculaceae bacterium]|nr:bifunctional UDP-3-O-[3-hydroxymyristoyl] N-acetylglucosamine deacetylase/3-hydroxyacyl-ACP dehydratase [Muribaculaceae bacterium]
MKQQTLKDSFSVKGKVLHTGLEIEATFCPAPENHGYKLQRTDLPDEPTIDAVAENVVESNRGTVVSQDNVSVSTIEHAMAALYALGIDNCLIKVSAPELPILDGSSKIYVEKIEEVGIEEQNADKEYYVVKHKLEFEGENGSKIMVLPDDEFSVEVKINFDSPVLQNQYASMEHVSEFPKEIASSRTFVFVREIEQLLNANLIKGGDLDNAIVIYDSPLSQEQLDHIADLVGVPHKEVNEYGIISNFELTSTNEPARHKLLDVIGDLALIGRPLKGKVIATRPGHLINGKFAKMIRREIRRQDVQAPVYDPNAQPLMDNNDIRRHLPHRYPFLLVDKFIDRGANYIV